MKWEDAIPMAPAMRMDFRPNRSTQSTAGMVKRNSRMPTTPVASRAVVFARRFKSWKMKGLE